MRFKFALSVLAIATVQLQGQMGNCAGEFTKKGLLETHEAYAFSAFRVTFNSNVTPSLEQTSESGEFRRPSIQPEQLCELKSTWVAKGQVPLNKHSFKTLALKVAVVSKNEKCTEAGPIIFATTVQSETLVDLN